MNFIDKYIPNTQKSLFHKDICAHIRKWTTNLLENDLTDKKKILFIYGPVGCGKTASINILLKPFQIINIDSNELRHEKSCDLINSLVGFNDITLSNIEKWNHNNKKQKPNIAVIDNIELCDKNIVNFVENIHVKNNINIPILLICNNQKYKNIFSHHKNCTYIEFNKPSLLELSKLILDINEKEKLNLSKENIKIIINKSEFDIRQIFYLLDQWKLYPFNFTNFIETIDTKHADIDLTDKLIYLTDKNKQFDISYTFTLSTSEPITISNGLFQNYTNIIEHYNSVDDLDNLEKCINIIDNISFSNVLYSEIVEKQNWELYDSYTINSCVIPSYHLKNIKSYEKEKSDINNITNEQELYYKMNAFKDISYNYFNSFNEVKNIVSENIFSKNLNTNNNKYDSYNITKQESGFYFDFIKICLSQIKTINEDFEKNKKGKNTTKSEKISLCKNITANAKNSLDFIVDKIYFYKLFEFPIDEILLNKNKYFINEKNKNILNDDQIIKDIEKINIRVFKRLLNIFSFNESSKVLKSHVEMAIKYKLFNLILEDIKLQKDAIKKTRIESLVQDLDELWNF